VPSIIRDNGSCPHLNNLTLVRLYNIIEAMGKKHLQDVKKALFLVIFTAILLAAQSALAIDILEIRVKRLYKEAEAFEEKGDYDGAIKAYNEAIGFTKDRDIRQFLINAKKEAQKKRRQEHGAVEISPPKGELEKPSTEKVTGGEGREETEKTGLEEEKVRLAVERRRLEEERARLEEERRKAEAAKLAEEKAKLEEEKASLEREKAMLEEEKQKEKAAKQAEVKEEKRPEEAEKQVVPPEEEITTEDLAKIEEKKHEEQEESAELEKRKEREAQDRAIYESTNYRYQVKEILNSARNKLKQTAARIKVEETLKRIEAKINKLAALDRQAEEFMSQGQYEKARGLYKEILNMSKDPDLKEYIKQQK